MPNRLRAVVLGAFVALSSTSSLASTLESVLERGYLSCGVNTARTTGGVGVVWMWMSAGPLLPPP